ncbi:hypothetical protein GPROT1_01199 [Gammaproteobacteria bacterium]|nr:hypothetical protein GPROT1_01199 [Gammaproteobacteria bacterium]
MNVFVIAGALFLIGTVAAYAWLTRRETPKA